MGKFSRWAPFLLLIIVAAVPVFADQCTVVNGYASGGAVSGCYSITTNSNQVTIELQNLTNPILNIGQTLTDFEFNLTSGFTIDASSLSVATTGFLYCNGTATCSTTLPAGVTASSPYGWLFNAPSGTSYDLNMLSGSSPGWTCTGLGNGACNLGGGIVNSSVVGNSDGLSNAAHNPYLTGPVYFTFDVTGAGTVSAADFTNPTLTWGTNGEVASPVPEPASLTLFGSGLVGLAGMLRRRMRSN